MTEHNDLARTEFGGHVLGVYPDGSGLIISLSSTPRPILVSAGKAADVARICAEARALGSAVWITVAPGTAKLLTCALTEAPAALPVVHHWPQAAQAAGASHLSMDELAQAFPIAVQPVCDAATAHTSDCNPWTYVDDYCHTRAEWMVRRLRSHGWTFGKAWLFGPLSLHTQLRPGCQASWTWHVAPFAWSVTGGGRALIVIDPVSSPTRWLTHVEWMQRLNVTPRVTWHFTDSAAYKPEFLSTDEEVASHSARWPTVFRDNAAYPANLVAARDEVTRQLPPPPYHC